MLKLQTPGNYTIPLSAGTPDKPSVIVQTDVQTERKGFFAGLKRAFGKQIKSQFKITVRGFIDLIESKQKYIKLLPSQCMINKKLLPFFACYRQYLSELILAENLQQYRKVDQDAIISQFENIIDCPDICEQLIKYWDSELYFLHE